MRKRDASPCEDGSLKDFFHKDIRDQSRMPSIAVRKTVDEDETLAEPHRDLIGWVRAVLDPVLAVIEEIPKLDTDLEFVDADVLVRTTEFPSPFPHVREHASMQHAHEVFIQDFRGGEGTRHRPLDGILDVLLFEFIQFRSHGDGRNKKSLLLILVDGGLPVDVFEF